MRRRFNVPRWLYLGGGIGLGTITIVALALYIFYPRIAAWAIRERVLSKLEHRLDREVRAGDIEVNRDGRAVLRDVLISGPNDGDEPLIRIGKVTIHYSFWGSVKGDMRIERVIVEDLSGVAVRAADGSDNFADIIARFTGSDEGGGGGGLRAGLRPDTLELVRARGELRDERSGVALRAADVALFAQRGGLATLTLKEISVATSFGPTAGIAQLVATAEVDAPRDTAEFVVAGGRVKLWPGMSLTGIGGTLSEADAPGKLFVDLAGGYGGVEGELWTAKGWLDPWQRSGSLDLSADRFTFDRIASVIEGSMVVDYAATSVDTNFHLDMTPAEVTFNGNLALSGLNIYHPMFAERTVRDINLVGPISGSFASDARVLTLTRADLIMGGVEYKLAGYARLPGGVDVDSGERRQHYRVGGRVVIPPLPCQKMLDGIPKEFAARIHGAELRGTFAADVTVDINGADLQATVLDGGVGIRRCRAVKVPEEIDGKRFAESFVHVVDPAAAEPISFTIGPENPDFVPIWDVSPYLLKSLMTTEDGRFYRHKGFIVSEFRTALIKNLEAGRFKYGASSITMQMIKNVMLYREKTLSRKLQELFLTWYIETVLEKDRIFEIYINAIEYGPELYGIGPAARRYFGKHPRDLNPVEAAFFSSLLPDPKRRYRQYCDNKLWPRMARKIERIVKLMHKRERITDDEFEMAINTPLVFERDEAHVSRRDCRDFVDAVLEETLSTDPVRRLRQLEEQQRNPRKKRKSRPVWREPDEG